MSNQEITGHIERLVKEYKLAEESLTEKQLVEVLRQIIASGDIQRLVQIDSRKQAVVYMPYSRYQQMQAVIDHLNEELAKAHKELIGKL